MNAYWLIDNLRHFFTENKWHQQGGIYKKGHACLIVGLSEVRKRTDTSWDVWSEVVDAFSKDPEVQRFHDPSRNNSSVSILIRYNDHPSTTWEDVRAMIERVKQSLEQRS